MKPQISVVVPVFNEEKRIANLLKLDRLLFRRSYSSEIVVVNDGSTDKTLSIIKKLKLNNRLILISYNRNRGKGYAVKRGMLKSKGKYRFFLDVDLSTPPLTIIRFLREMKKGYDVVVGSRKVKGARLIERQSPFREFLGKGFTFFSKVFLGLNVSDITCGFKCFSDKAAKQIFRKVTVDRWGFDSEILFIAKKLGYSVLEIPVSWKNDPNTKVKIPRDIYGSLKDLIKIRLNDFRGVY